MDKVKFKRNIGQSGNSASVTIPKELMEYIEGNVGDEVEMFGDKGKHGKYIAFWKPNEENENK